MAKEGKRERATAVPNPSTILIQADASSDFASSHDIFLPDVSSDVSMSHTIGTTLIEHNCDAGGGGREQW